MRKIPEGATHTYGSEYKKLRPGSHSMWLTYADGDWIDTINAMPHLYVLILAEPEWSGEGIPPSGTSCEMRRADYVNVGWQKIEFLFAGSKKAFFRDEQGHEWSRPLSDLKFRSIRTPEQIAAEKRDAAIKEMQRLVGSCNTFPFAELYDYGYRLQVAE